MKRLLTVLILAICALGAGALGAQNEQYPQNPPVNTQQPSELPPPPPGQPSEQQPAQQSADQPGVARLSYIHGDVSTQRGDNSQWVAATLNTPIEPGDRVSTGQGARAEIQFNGANVLRMSNDATANITALTRTGIQVQVGQGLASFAVLRGSESSSEIDTPNAAIRPIGEGDFRILVNSNAETQVVARNGSAEVSTPQGSTRVDKGQMITVAGTDNAQYKTDPAPGKDEWDSWNNDRDKVITSAESWRHTNPNYTGSEDLDRYGTWSEIPDYGPVWSPSVAGGWAPYRAGRWVWEPYYGWTWVSYEPWGWAPYHYGRWLVYGGSWVWWPGPVGMYPDYYPIWAPAYVSFFGFGGGFGFGFGVGFGFGRVGWLPIGPGDWFHPWYGRWGGRNTFVNINNFNNIHEGFGPLGRGRAGFSNIDGAFRNDRIRDGMSSMGRDEFGRGAVSSHQDRISEASFRQSSAMTGRMPLSPSRESFSASDRAASSATIRNGSAGSQRFFSASRPNSSFGNNAGNAMRDESGFNGNRNGGSVGNSERAPGSVSSGNQGGWNHFSPPASASRGGYGGASNSYNSSPRPSLNMRQPIVTPRSGSSSGGSPYSRGGSSSYGSSAPRGSYNAPHPSYSAPSAPRSYSAPRGGSSGGGSRGGGHSSHR